jgi:hypothetical protein
MRHWLAIVTSLLLAAPLHAQEPVAAADAATPETAMPEDAAPAEPLVKVRVNGFLDSRTTGAYAAVNHLLPANDVAHLANLSEGNVTLRLDWHEKATATADASFIFQKAGLFYGNDGTGDRLRLADHDVAAYRPTAVLSEFYGTYNFHDHFNMTLGKKRIVWGPGLAINPTDLLNPPKDPTDPTLQRAGSWLLRAEAPFDAFTLSFVAAGKVTRQFGGIPSSLILYPDAHPAPQYDAHGNVLPDGYDNRPHYALAARAYALWKETDFDLYWFQTQRYNDAFNYKNRLGLSASHVFFNALELHVEAIGYQGSSKLYFDPDCIASQAAAIGCVQSGKMPAGYTQIDDSGVRIKALAGGRWQFGDNASFTFEYFYNGEGYNSSEFNTFARGAQFRQQAVAAQAAGLPIDPNLLALLNPMSVADPGSPQKFTFEPMRRHYAFFTYLHTMIADDWNINAVVLLGLEDLSGQIAPQVTWLTREWLNLTLGGLYTIPGVKSLGAQVDGNQYTENAMQPTIWRLFFSARVFY